MHFCDVQNKETLSSESYWAPIGFEALLCVWEFENVTGNMANEHPGHDHNVGSLLKLQWLIYKGCVAAPSQVSVLVRWLWEKGLVF